MEFSSPTGPVGVFNRDGLGLGLLGFLCPFLCLCCCFPVATASIKDARTGDQLLKGGAYLLPRKVKYIKIYERVIFHLQHFNILLYID